jgi:high-affinity Fe2+/Pb2+ permease
MNATSETVNKGPSIATMTGNAFSALFGLLVICIGFVNTFWGNDPGYGIFLLLISFVFFAPVTHWFKKVTGFGIPWYLKLLLAGFIIWSAVGVGELGDKVDLMLQD